MDSASAGVCQLDFVPLTDSFATVSPTCFGMKVEVYITTSHDTSRSLLRFSTDGGSVYYNKDEPWETVCLHHNIPLGRKLRDCNRNCDPMSPYDD